MARRRREAKAIEYKHMTFYEAAETGKGSRSEEDVADALQSVPGKTGRISGRSAEDICPILSRGKRRKKYDSVI